MNILLVEDNEDHYELIRSALLGFDNGVSNVTHAKSLAQANHEIKAQLFDVILFDLSLPDSTITDTVEYLTELKCESPIVVLSSLDDLDIAKELLRHEIQDYVPKDEISPGFLNRVCTYAIERKYQQNKLEQRNKDMQAFCSMLSHDFKGAVRRIGHLASFLQEDISERVELTEKESKFFNSIQTNTQSVQEMVNSLKDYLTVSYTTPKLDKVDLKTLIEDIRDDLQELGGKSFTLNVSEPIASLFAHRSLMHHLLLNIINNSIKYNHNHPEINIKTEAANGNQIKIVVEDNGIGIEPKHQQEIFKPFKRLFTNDEYTGTGLGLSIVTRIAELHQGRVELESKVGEGSRFSIFIPKNPFS